MSNDSNSEPISDGEPLAVRLLAIVRALAIELAPDRARIPVGLDTRLDRELGFDSLSRVELLQRLEESLGIRFSERAFSSAETPRDLLDAITEGVGQSQPLELPGATEEAPLVLGPAQTIPASVETLSGVLEWRARQTPERTHMLLYEEDQREPLNLTFADLHAGARALAAGLQAAGLAPGAAVAIMLGTSRDYLETFFGALLAGGVPVPIYPPARPSQLEDHLQRHARILQSAEARFLVTVPEGRQIGRLLKQQVPSLVSIRTPQDLCREQQPFAPVATTGSDVAFLQYTSGSTGQPKGVVLTHADLLNNIRAMGEWVQAGPEDVFVSWLPLYHDMGLIGAWLGSLYYAMLAVLMPPTAFLVRPARWLETVSRHRATLTAAPNFAWELCLTRVAEESLADIDLSSLRLMFNGAEPVRPETLRRFQSRFEACGLDPRAICPVYGLAEVAVGLAFPPLGRGPVIDRVQREPFERTGRAIPADGNQPALEFVACGQPLPGYEIRIVDDGDRELPDRHTGHLQFRGPSATRGYRNNPEATAALFHGDWLDSGDLAYVAAGDVYLTSREKDMIIRGGRNLYPYELEEAVGELPGVRRGCVAVFGSTQENGGVERLVIVAETRLQDADELERLKAGIEATCMDVLGVAPDDVVLAPP